jgi:glycosyltransferase involved in cell wall biosynthesis
MVKKLKNKLKQIKFLKYIVYNFQLVCLRNFKDNSYKYFPYPWLTSTDKRIAELKASKKANIVYIHDKPDPLTFRYRAYNMTQILNKTDKYQAHYFFENELGELFNEVENINLLIFIRIGWSPDAIKLVKILKDQGKKIGYDTDDFIFDINFVPELIKQIAAPRESHGYYFYYTGIIYNLAKHTDFFTCTNEFLQKQIERFFDKKCFVISNFLNDEQINKAKEINSKPKSRKQPEFILGYFAGTKTHDRDFEIIADQVIQIFEEFPEVKLMIVGHLNLPASFNKYSKRIKQHGLKDYLALQELISEVDINLAPLVINDFTNCKSELKFFDAGLVRVPTIASPSFAFEQAIKDHENGLLAKENQWYEKIKLLITDKNLYNKISEAAYETSINSYYGATINEKVISTINKLI